MEGIKIKSINTPQYVNWDSFDIKDMNATNVVIYAHNLKREVSTDLEKLKILKQMPNLQFITINSDEFNVGIYMGELLKDLPLVKDFHLLDDFQNRDRSIYKQVLYQKVLDLEVFLIHIFNGVQIKRT